MNCQETQHRFEAIRTIVNDIFPGAEERIYHAVPTFSINGKDILNIGAYKNHITLYIGYELTALLKPKYPNYQYGVASMKITDKEPLPAELIQEICMVLKSLLDV